jgi:biotin carboxyl carrier protein
LMENSKHNRFLIDDTEYETTLPGKFLKRKPYQKTDNKKITAFIPGLIVSLYVEKGKKVKMGDKLLVLEAMKMKNDVKSPVDGIIKEVAIKEGSVVIKNQFLLEIE